MPELIGLVGKESVHFAAKHIAKATDGNSGKMYVCFIATSCGPVCEYEKRPNREWNSNNHGRHQAILRADNLPV